MTPFQVVFSIIGILIGALFIYALHKLLDKIRDTHDTEKKKTKVSIKDDAEYNVHINQLIYKLKRALNADKVCVNRFHNGGYFANGFDMKKFSMTHETPLGSNKPMMDKCQGVLNSRYPEAFLSLVTLGEYFVYDVTSCDDPNFKHDMIDYGFSATFLFLIKQFNGNDEGFIGINFKDTKVLTPEELDKVRDTIPTLLGLINMTKV